MALSMRSQRLFAHCSGRGFTPRLVACRAEPAKQQGTSGTEYKRTAAAKFVDTYVKDGCILGLGSGELSNLVIDLVGVRLATGRLNNVKGVPSCEVAAAAAAFHGLPLTSLDKCQQVDVAFEEADLYDASSNSGVKGVMREPQQPQLVSVWQLARRCGKFVLLVDESKVVKRLRGPLPIVIDAINWEGTAEELDDIFLGDAELWRRPTFGSAPPRGGDNPYLSPEGHNILDVVFEGTFKLFGEEQPYSKMLEEIDNVEGVVAHGLFHNMAKAVVVAKKAGEPQLLEF